MKKTITIDDLENLALGAAVLGSGGGGNPQYDILIAKNQLQKYGPVPLISVADLKPDDLIVPVAFMGAPLIAIEKLPNGTEFKTIFELIEKHLGKKPTAIMAAEIGGANAFTPLTIAGHLGLPVLDADLLGRAFPQLQMSSANLTGISASPAFVADGLNNGVVINTADANMLESIARVVTVSMGSSAALAAYLLNGTQAQYATIPGTITQALSIGRAITEARQTNNDPIKALVSYCGGMSTGSGTIVDIDQAIKDGFLQGTATIQNCKETIKLVYQNENLILERDNKICATSPDIIIPLDTQTGSPITSESLAYGLNVSIVVIPAPTLWQTPKGLELVGPRAFGYDIDYKVIEGN